MHFPRVLEKVLDHYGLERSWCNDEEDAEEGGGVDHGEVGLRQASVLGVGGLDLVLQVEAGRQLGGQLLQPPLDLFGGLMVLLLLVLLEEVLNHVLLLLYLVGLDGEVDGLGVDQGELVVKAGLVIANDLKVEDKLQEVANEIKKFGK